MRRAPTIALDAEEERTLQGWAAGAGETRRAVRSRIVLEAARGRTNAQIAAELATHPETVARWRARFAVNGLEGVEREAPRRGDRRRVASETVERVLDASLQPADTGERRWSTRGLARSLQVNHMLVHRIWRAHGLVEAEATGDPSFALPAPTVELAGVVLTERLRAVVFAVGPTGLPGTWAGSTAVDGPDVRLSALAANVEELADEVVHAVRRLERVGRRRLHAPRSPAPVLVFLRSLERHTPPHARLDVVVDRASERIDPPVARWLEAHARFRLYPRGRGLSWSESVGGWLHRWVSAGVDGESLKGTPELARAFPGLAGVDRPRAERLSWVNSLSAFSPTVGSADGRTRRTPGPSRATIG